MSRHALPRDEPPAALHAMLTRRRHTALKKAAADEGISMNELLNRFIDREIIPRYETPRAERPHAILSKA